MKRKIPTISVLSRKKVILFYIFYVIIAGYLVRLFPKQSLLVIGSTLLVFGAFLLIPRFTIGNHFRLGLKQVKKGNFQEALPYFERSIEVFLKSPWKDKLLTTSALISMPYLELSYVNAAYCLSNLGRVDDSIIYYKKTLEMNPNNYIALSSLENIDQIKNYYKETNEEPSHKSE